MITFRLKRPSCPRTTAIYAHVCLDYWQAKLGIDFLIEPKLWDATKQRVKPSAIGAATINAEIGKARADVGTIVATMRALGEPLTPERLHSEWEIMRGKRQARKPADCFAVFDSCITDSATMKQPRTIPIYRTVKS